MKLPEYLGAVFGNPKDSVWTNVHAYAGPHLKRRLKGDRKVKIKLIRYRKLDEKVFVFDIRGDLTAEQVSEVEDHEEREFFNRDFFEVSVEGTLLPVKREEWIMKAPEPVYVPARVKIDHPDFIGLVVDLNFVRGSLTGGQDWEVGDAFSPAIPVSG